MRRLLLLSAALTLSIAPLAHADVYTYTFNGQSPEPGVNISDFETFTIDPSMQFAYTPEPFQPSCNAPDCFSVQDLNGDGTRQFMRNGGIENNNSDFLSTEEYLYLYANSTFPPAVVPFTGPSDDPTLLTGTFYAYAYFPDLSYSAVGPITIVDDTLAASAVPEPSTLALLGAGVLGLAGAIRRRLADSPR